MPSNRQISIARDLKDNIIFVFILLVGSIPQIFGGYSAYLLVLLYPYILLRSRLRISPGFVLSLIFGLSYIIPLYFHESETNFASIMFMLLYPSLYYLIPKYISKRFRNPNSIFVITVLVITCIAGWSIWMNVLDTIQSGQIVNIRRSLRSSMDNFEGVTSATNHNMMLALGMSGFGLIFVKAKNDFEKRVKWFLILLGVLSFFSGIHLLNRTAIALVAIACLIPLLIGGWNAKYYVWILGVALILAIIYFLFIDGSIAAKEITEGIMSREETSGSLQSGNDRDIRWLAAIEQIPEFPLGSDYLMLDGKHTFAHNTWLDCGVQAGWLAFILLIVITLRFIKSAYYLVFKNKTVPDFWRAYFAIVTCVLLAQMAVEPVIQGITSLFFMMFYLWSLYQVLNSRTYMKRKRLTHIPNEIIYKNENCNNYYCI